jgi:HSP20 family protein
MPPIDDWQREMERYLAHFARTGKRPTIIFSQHAHSTPMWTPAVDMYETDGSVVVLLDLAGIDPDETQVEAEPNRLVVRGRRRERHAPVQGAEHRTYHALEIPYGRFERSLPLPAGLDTAAAQANYRDGLLEITLPKRAPHQVRIAVHEGAAADVE